MRLNPETVTHQEMAVAKMKLAALMIYGAALTLIGGIVPAVILMGLAYYPFFKHAPGNKTKRYLLYLIITVVTFILAGLVIDTPYEIRFI